MDHVLAILFPSPKRLRSMWESCRLKEDAHRNYIPGNKNLHEW